MEFSRRAGVYCSGWWLNNMSDLKLPCYLTCKPAHVPIAFWYGMPAWKFQYNIDPTLKLQRRSRCHNNSHAPNRRLLATCITDIACIYICITDIACIYIRITDIACIYTRITENCSFKKCVQLQRRVVGSKYKHVAECRPIVVSDDTTAQHAPNICIPAPSIEPMSLRHEGAQNTALPTTVLQAISDVTDYMCMKLLLHVSSTSL